MSDIAQRTESTDGGHRFLKNLAYLVPGYRGYKDKNLRREEDARLRNRVLGKLAEFHDLLRVRHEKLDELSLDAARDQLERRIERIDGLIRAVRFAPYGFSGFFEAVEVREELLEQILEVDLLLFQDLDETIELIWGTPFPPSNQRGFRKFFESIRTATERIETRLVARDKLLGDC